MSYSVLKLNSYIAQLTVKVPASAGMSSGASPVAYSRLLEKGIKFHVRSGYSKVGQ